MFTVHKMGCSKILIEGDEILLLQKKKPEMEYAYKLTMNFC